MARRVLLLRLEGVWQSWGERSRWDVRDTQTEPTKSGVIGLLGCALGYSMRDLRLENELDAGLRFGVRVESPGQVVQDYQTITDFLPTAEGSFRHSGVATAKSLEKLRNDPDAVPATIISPRYYLEDASFLVALEERKGFDGLLDKCSSALEKPKWPMFLGRKACVPTRPVYDPNDQGHYESIENALSCHSWSWLGIRGEPREGRPDECRAYIEESTGQPYTDYPNMRLMRRSSRQDAMRTNQMRSYGFRMVREYSIRLQKEGDEGVSVNA